LIVWSERFFEEILGVVCTKKHSSSVGGEHLFDQGKGGVTPACENSRMQTTIASLSREISTEADAYSFLENLRWHGEARCPKCDSTDVHYIAPGNGVSATSAGGSQSERRVWKCHPCRKQFSVVTGTMMHATKIPVRVWVMVIFEMCSSKNGVAAREIERKYGVCPRTAWHMLGRIREAMSHRDGYLFTGDVLADETFIGGDPHNWHADRRAKMGARAGHGSRKVPVVSLIDTERGVARSAVVPWVDFKALCDVISANVDMANAVLHTDSYRGYIPVGRVMAGHHVVDHKAGRYVTEKSKGTNQVENFFSQLKRSLNGTHHHVSVEHLHRYLGEFDFRYSTCQMSDAERMERLISQFDGRLTYKKVAA
jgi:transposase-like protein